MAFSSAYTAQTTKAINLPLIFVRAGNAKLSNIECDAIVSGRTVPTSGGWVQIESGDGGAQLTVNRTTLQIKSQQSGITDEVIDEEIAELQLNLAAMGVDEMAYLGLIDTGKDPTNDAVDIVEKSGVSLKPYGFSILVYPRSADADNTSNTPSFASSNDTLVLFNCVNKGNTPIVYDKTQNTAQLTLTPLASESTGAAKRRKGVYGKMTALV